MKELSTDLRTAIITALSPFVVEGITIPIVDGVLTDKDTVPAFGSALGAYVRITDQSGVDTTNQKCTFRHLENITLDVVTHYPKGFGRKLDSEKIANAIGTTINTFAENGITLASGWQLLRVRKQVSQSISEEPQGESIQRKVMIYEVTAVER